MAAGGDERAESARRAGAEDLRGLIHSPDPGVLAGVLENPGLDEPLLLALLERLDLPGEVLGQVARRKEWMKSYAVRLRVARHPKTPRLAALGLVKQIYLFDLVKLSLTPGVLVELKRVAEEQILSRMAQLPLGEKLTLARRGSGRVAAAVVAEGHPLAIEPGLDNQFLTEANMLKLLAQADLPEAVVEAVARHPKWSLLYNVRIALVRHTLTPLARVLGFLPDITLRDLNDLASLRSLDAHLRTYIRGEIEARGERGRRRVQ